MGHIMANNENNFYDFLVQAAEKADVKDVEKYSVYIEFPCYFTPGEAFENLE